MEAYYKLKNGNILKVEEDDDPENPRSFGCMTKMVCFHNRYNLGDKHSYKKNDYNSWDDIKKAIESNENVVIIQPLYLYDHSGITISTNSFKDNWDSGCVGFVYVTKETLRKEYNVKNVTKTIIRKGKQIVLGEVETYDFYVSGNIYHGIEYDKTGDIVESCGGFYGYDIKINGMADTWEFESFSEVKVKKHEVLEIIK